MLLKPYYSTFLYCFCSVMLAYFVALEGRFIGEVTLQVRAIDQDM